MPFSLLFFFKCYYFSHLQMPDKKQPEETSRGGEGFCASGFRGCSPPSQEKRDRKSMEAEWPEAVAAACSHLGGPRGTEGASWCAHVSSHMSNCAWGPYLEDDAGNIPFSVSCFWKCLHRFRPQGVLHLKPLCFLFQSN